MADDDTLDPEDEQIEDATEDEAEVADVDPDELDEEELEVEGDEFGGSDDEFTETAEEDDADEDESDGPVRKSVPAVAEDDDDDDMLAPDDVEADLDTILKDRLVAADEDGDEDEDDEPEEKGESADRLQPKRSDEQLCPNCFLLVRNSAPNCPIGDDDCPILAAR